MHLAQRFATALTSKLALWQSNILNDEQKKGDRSGAVNTLRSATTSTQQHVPT
jgi:hypothetical protein